MLTLELVKQHLRIEDDSEDELIQNYLDAAVEHYKDITGLDNNADSKASYKMMILRKVGTFYFYREDITEGNAKALPDEADLLWSLRPGDSIVTFAKD